MNLLSTINAYLEHNYDGLDFLTRDKNAFHSRDASVIFKTGFAQAEIDLRLKHNLCPNVIEGKCMRALYYDFQRNIITNPIEASGIRTMDLGSACESVEGEYYKSLGIHHSHHIRMYDKIHNISGEVDNLVWEYQDILLPNGELSGKITICEPRRLIGVEIKSFYGYYAEKEIIKEGKPKWNHVLQALVYLDYFKKNIPYWLIVYLSRGGGIDTDNGRVFGRQFKLQISKLTGEIYIDGILMNEFTMANVYKRFAEVAQFIAGNILPPRDYVYNYPRDLVDYKFQVKGELSKASYNDYLKGNSYVSDWQCNYCPYLYECWKDKFGRNVRGASKQEAKDGGTGKTGGADASVKSEADSVKDNTTEEGADTEG